MTAPRRRWQARAACNGHELREFFPDNPDTYDRDVERAKEFCGHCPVRRECLADELHVMAQHGATTTYGVRGGLSKPERVRLFRAEREAAVS